MILLFDKIPKISGQQYNVTLRFIIIIIVYKFRRACGGVQNYFSGHFFGFFTLLLMGKTTEPLNLKKCTFQGVAKSVHKKVCMLDFVHNLFTALHNDT